MQASFKYDNFCTEYKQRGRKYMMISDLYIAIIPFIVVLCYLPLQIFISNLLNNTNLSYFKKNLDNKRLNM